ncbi:acyl-protein thioesterase 1-like isoform X2 [Panonychus citri]|uniref:acyl-protein thioesterase 1-like isoform X1 n=1 Tax=Panonychus citri TaxID=50023 RepID=UPI002306F36C|nr:acyl-protein thioesterase 1-like isoform X1 [Panonychus citri]XP_053214735.1 acyl-protein thioesterase 1-like isoform X2 [Panonychus citri]
MASGSKPVVIDSRDGKHTATIIFLHGLGDTGHGWADSLSAIQPSYCKLICPTAPVQPVTLNAGMIMPSWFDLMTLTHDGPEDGEGILKASASIMKIIEEEQSKHNIPSNRILLGGFSQGGALSLHTGLRYSQPLAGILALSCWLPLHKEYPNAFVQGNKEVPILQCHGDSDPLVPKMWGNITADILKEMLKTTEFKVYRNMGHTSCNEEMRDAAEFIKKCLPPV